MLAAALIPSAQAQGIFDCVDVTPRGETSVSLGDDGSDYGASYFHSFISYEVDAAAFVEPTCFAPCLLNGSLCGVFPS